MTIEDFKLPIEYTKKKKLIDKNILKDLELIENDERKSIYFYIFEPKTNFGHTTLNLWAKYYTYDKRFLKDSQKLIKNFKNTVTIEDISFDDISSICEEFKDDYFLEKYQYIDWKWFKHLNNNANILQFLSLYNLSSPILSLLTPLVMLIMPFFIIKLQKYDVTLEKYLAYLKSVFSKHALGPLLNADFSKIPIEKKVYFIVSFLFYLYQIYQNIMSCIKFNANMKIIHNYLFKIKTYSQYSIKIMDNFYKYSSKLTTYKPFNNNLINNKNFLIEFIDKLNKITTYGLNIPKLLQIGYVLQVFYFIYDNKDYLKCLNYTFNFHGYIENLNGLKWNIKNKFMNFSTYSNKCKFTNAYFPNLKNENPIKNSYKLKKHMIITGPNAAGKTTLLKTTLINIIFNQQFACGFYDSASLKLYNYIHCYINIPDTSGRDSLFQAEARRCKEILDKINKNSKDKKHFCVFDELYSGTNPYEAIGSAFSFIKYLNEYDNLNLILTTHYTDLCDKLNDEKYIENYNMKIIENNNKFKYTYELIKGISRIKGGTKVLNDLKYPNSIVNSVKNVIDSLQI